MTAQLTFLHTADLQIGMAAPGLGPLASQVQEARIASLKTILKLGAERKVNFVIIVGDLFETNQVSKKCALEVVNILENASPLLIFILPGNHDYYGPNSVYARSEFLHLGKHVHIFSERKPYIIPDLDITFYPSPCFETRGNESPINWIKKQSGTKYHIAIVHGSIPSRFGGNQAEDEYFPMNEKELRNLGMDYIALGHWHSLHPDPKEESDSPFYYSGTPEPTGFGEKLSGFALLVELGETGRKITPIYTSKYQFIDVQKTVASSTDIDSIQTELSNFPQPENKLIRITLNGIISIALREQIEQLVGEWNAKFPYVRLIETGLLLEPSDSDLAEFMKGGIAQSTISLLQRKRDAANSSDKAKYARAISLTYRAFKGHLS